MKFPYKKVPRSSDPKVPHIPSPYLPVTMHRGGAFTIPVFALLDSGADTIIMPSHLAEDLGIPDVRVGRLQKTIGVGQQKVDVYYHDGIEVQLVGDSRKLPIEIGFIENTPERRATPLLGRSFFAHFKSITFDQNGEVMELKPPKELKIKSRPII